MTGGDDVHHSSAPFDPTTRSSPGPDPDSNPLIMRFPLFFGSGPTTTQVAPRSGIWEFTVASQPVGDWLEDVRAVAVEVATRGGRLVGVPRVYRTEQSADEAFPLSGGAIEGDATRWALSGSKPIPLPAGATMTVRFRIEDAVEGETMLCAALVVRARRSRISQRPAP